MPSRLEALPDLALNMRWSWDHSMDFIWQKLDEELWEQTRNPWLILLSSSDTQLEQLARNAEFVESLDEVTEAQKRILSCDCWFHHSGYSDSITGVAYFCMEYGLSEALPLYSGGLGILAGDTLKTSSDLGLPLTGIGLLYQQGYFRQVFDTSGAQREFYPYNDPLQLPVLPVRDDTGEWLHVHIPMPGRRLRLRVWRALVGRVELFLLDSNDPRNSPSDRGITSELYGGGQETRLQQEMILGIGGVRVIEALKRNCDVFHLNEGHASLAVVERANRFALAEGCSFDVALTATRSGNLLTTHTPVLAGFDRFPEQQVRHHLSAYAEETNLSLDRLCALGCEGVKQHRFNMTWLGIRGCGALNAVSQVHQGVSRRIFEPLFPRWPESQIPVDRVTNGVHMPSWDSKQADTLWTRTCGKNRWLSDLAEVESAIKQVPDEELWALRAESRRQLVNYARHRLRAERLTQELNTEVLDPNVLTLCFARRFTDYKRPNLLLEQPQRLLALFRNEQQPLQLLIAGKAHPKDEAGKAMVEEWNRFIRDHALEDRVLFLADYDIRVAEQLVAGADLWVNTPRRPWEACGTSGMKVLVNGGLNLSELDGWWAEAYRSELGWGLASGEPANPASLGSVRETDAQEAERLYQILENEVIPCFYQRDLQGVPRDWVTRMRASITELTTKYSSNRMLRQYVEQHYLTRAEQIQRRTSDGGELAMDIEIWRSTLDRHWAMLHFGDLDVTSDSGCHLFKLPVYLDELEVDMVEVQLFAEARQDQPEEIHPMQRLSELPGAVNGYLYQCRLQATRPREDYTPRLIPHHADAEVPLESQRILWHH